MLPLVSHGEYADGTDRRTDGWTPDRYIIRFPLDAASVKSVVSWTNDMRAKYMQVTSNWKSIPFRAAIYDA